MELSSDTIGRYINRVFEKFPDREALVYIEDGRRITYSQLNKEIEKVVKNLIAAGIKKGQHVALHMYNSPEWIITFIALSKIGAISVCLNYNSTEEEIAYMLNQSKSEVVITDDKEMIEKIKDRKCDYLKLVLETEILFKLFSFIRQMNEEIYISMEDILDDVCPEDVAAILYTSGTTGQPKGVMMTQQAILNGPISFLENFQYTENDIILASLPLNHILGGLYTAILGLLAGSKVILMKKFRTSQALQAIEDEKCTSFHGVPTTYQYLINKCSNHDLSSLRVGMIAGSISGETLMKDIMEKLHISELNNTFGQTETLGVTQTTVYDVNNPKIRTVGKPIEHVQIRICDSVTNEILPINTEGELLVKSPFGMVGYYNDEVATRDAISDGWIHTGDTAIIDEDGYLSIKGRIKDIIIRGGENISPIEIEKCLNNSLQIEESVIVGVPDDILGEEIVAFVKLSNNSSIGEEEIFDYMNEKISKYKIPKYIEFIESWPLTSTGKIARNKLKEVFMNKLINI